jgi:hypothetical protein
MSTRFYDTDLTNAAWAWVAPVLRADWAGDRANQPSCRPQLHLLPSADRLPMATFATRISTLGHGLPLLSGLANSGVWVHLHRVLYEQACRDAGRAACPSVVIMDGQSVKTTERGGTRGLDAYKRIKGHKRHNLVDTLGLPLANRVEPADRSDRRVCAGSVATLELRRSLAIASAKLDRHRAIRRRVRASQHFRLFLGSLAYDRRL